MVDAISPLKVNQVVGPEYLWTPSVGNGVVTEASTT
jgi:hypothetical protein